MWLYSKTTRGFHLEGLSLNIPADAVEISEDYKNELLAGESAGLMITPDKKGYPVLVERPKPTAEQVMQTMRAAVQVHMDAVARDYGYDDVKAAVTYAEEPAVPKFQAEGRAFREWRSLVWAYAYDVLNEVQAGKRDQPTEEQLIEGLPKLVIK